jgi:hypothetical protein
MSAMLRIQYVANQSTIPINKKLHLIKRGGGQTINDVVKT